MSNNWRINYTDIDSSVATTSQPDTSIKGYMVVNAPKGQAAPLYFKPGSRQKILSLVGAPSSKYPLIQDAIDFNDQYGLFISSPAGGTENYPSYYGGMYITDFGPFMFDKVTSKEAPNFNGLLQVTKEAKLGESAPATLSLVTTTFTLANVNLTTWQLAKGLRITFTKSGSALKGKVIECTISNKSTTPVLTTLVSGVSQDVGVITENSGVYSIVMAGTNASVPDMNWGTNATPANAYVTAITGTGDNTIANAFTFEWILDLSNNTYFYLAQRSQTEEITTVNFKKLSVLADASVTVNDVTITSVGHGFAANDQVIFSGTVPPQIDVTKRYYVLSTGLTTDAFKVSNSRGGSAITFGESGTFTGTQTRNFFVRDYNYAENTITFSTSETAYGAKMISDGTFTASLVPTSTNSNGVSNYLPLLLPKDGGTLVEGYVIKPFDGSVISKTDVGSYTLFGQRYASSTGAVLANVLQEGWDEAVAGYYDSVSIFMEPSGEDALKSSLVSMRSATYKTATYIAHVTGTTTSESLTSRSASPDSRGVAYYANKLLRDEAYTNTQFWSSCIGAIGVKLANIMERKMGGWAPHFADFNGLGGSLGVTSRKQLIKWDDDNQRLADKEGLNLIILDSFQGPMIIGQKTAQDPGTLTDWSFLAHSMAFDMIKKEISDNVLAPQLGKPIDDKFMGMRQSQADAILLKRLSGPNKIWTAGVVDAFSFNDDTAKAAGAFKLSLKVKVTKFSEAVELILENSAQDAVL